MRKLIVFAAAGAGLFITGCTRDVMSDRRYIPIAQNDPVMMEERDVVPEKPINIEPEVKKNQRAVLKYEPMTDVVSSGGVDSAPRSKGSKAVAGKGGVYIIKRGDTPERIARRHGVKLVALMNANNLDQASARRLQIGQKLVIPGKDGSAAVIKKSTVKKVDTTPAPALDGGKYTVKSGDTPERIARRYKVKLADLLKANNMDESSARRMQIGQKLIIPGKEIAPVVTQESVIAPNQGTTPAIPAATDVSSPVPTTETPATDAVVTSEVVSETVTVSEKTETTATDGDANIVVYEVPEDTTYAELAAKHGVSEAELRKLNSDVDKLTKSTMIYLPKK